MYTILEQLKLYLINQYEIQFGAKKKIGTSFYNYVSDKSDT